MQQKPQENNSIRGPGMMSHYVLLASWVWSCRKESLIIFEILLLTAFCICIDSHWCWQWKYRISLFVHFAAKCLHCAESFNGDSKDSHNTLCYIILSIIGFSVDELNDSCFVLGSGWEKRFFKRFSYLIEQKICKHRFFEKR